MKPRFFSQALGWSLFYWQPAPPERLSHPRRRKWICLKRQLKLLKVSPRRKPRAKRLLWPLYLLRVVLILKRLIQPLSGWCRVRCN